MGINVHALHLLLYASRRGTDFSTTITLGRQGRNFSVASLVSAARRFSKPLEGWLEKIGSEKFSEPLFYWLGAQHVDSLDVNEYQGASVIHDLNNPLPARLNSKYSLVLDSGTLEHVFNFPEAIHSCIRLLRPGGYYLAVTPANNFMGHGFYQFSPELFFNVFAQNGFGSVEAFLASKAAANSWYRCPDPREMRSRITLSSLEPTFLILMARKDNDLTRFAFPQQSDYENAWKEGRAWSADGGALGRTLSRSLKALPEPLARLFARWIDMLNAARGLWARPKFRRFDPAVD